MLTKEDIEEIFRETNENTVAENSADFSMASDGGRIFSTQSTVVKYPKEYLTESIIPVRSTDLGKARKKIKLIRDCSSLFTDCFLALSTTLFGLFLGVFFCGLENLTLGKLTAYFAMLLAAVICFFVYFHMRSKAKINADSLASQALEYLPCPEECEEQEL